MFSLFTIHMNIDDVETTDNRTKKLTINITEEEFGHYELLRDEYGVKMNKEMWKVMAPKIKELVELYIKAKAS